MNTIQIKWLGHSCFLLEAQGYRIVLDPFEDGSVPGLKNIREKANLVLCSHDHFDHGAVKNVVVEEKKENPFTITTLSTFHDKEKGKKRGKNLIHILEYGGKRIAHMGDLGCEPTREQKEALKGLDVMLMPVGGFYTLEPAEVKELVEELSPRVLIPMHYRSSRFGFDNIATLESYTSLCSDVMCYPTDTLLVGEKELNKQTAVLTYQG